MNIKNWLFVRDFTGKNLNDHRFLATGNGQKTTNEKHPDSPCTFYACFSLVGFHRFYSFSLVLALFREKLKGNN